MALTIPTEIHKGPWILKEIDIEELDNIISGLEKHLEESLESEIIQAIESENTKEILFLKDRAKKIEEAKQRHSFDKKEKKIALISSNGKKLSGKSIREILKDPSLGPFIPDEFQIYLQFGNNNSIKLEIPSGENDDLKLDINCFDNSKSDDIRLDINKWINKTKSNKITEIWSSWGQLLTGASSIILFILAVQLFIPNYSKYESDLIKESKVLLDEGVNDNNRNKAIEILLKLRTEYVPKDFVPKKIERDPSILKWFCFTSFIFIIALIRPRTTIGLGKNKWKVDFYKYWIPFVTYTVPIAIIIVPLWENLKQFLPWGD